LVGRTIGRHHPVGRTWNQQQRSHANRNRDEGCHGNSPTPSHRAADHVEIAHDPPIQIDRSGVPIRKFPKFSGQLWIFVRAGELGLRLLRGHDPHTAREAGQWFTKKRTFEKPSMR
jgi:hypothetical protein